MNYFFPARILAIFSPVLGSANIPVESQPLINEEAVVYEGKTMKVIIPECPLAPGSLKIIPYSQEENFSEWQDTNKLETYQLIQKIAGILEKKGIEDYLVYGKEATNSTSVFGWEIVPYQKTGWRFWKQFKVLWSITFRGVCLPQIERHRLARDFQKDKDVFSEIQTKQIESIREIVKGNDAFCDEKIIKKQLVFEGKEVNVLYNYAPIAIGEGKLHFLIVPKHHHSKFTDLTETEYLESMQLSQKLVNFYKGKGYHTAYLFDKTGAEAGQTVPHWHEHVIFTATKTQEFLGQLTVFKNMIFGSSAIPQQELQTRVQSLKTELADVLRN